MIQIKNNILSIIFILIFTKCSNDKDTGTFYSNCIVSSNNLCNAKAEFFLDSSYIRNYEIGISGWGPDKFFMYENKTDTIAFAFYFDQIPIDRALKFSYDSTIIHHIINQLDESYHGNTKKILAEKKYFDKGLYIEYQSKTMNIMQFAGMKYNVCGKVLSFTILSESKKNVDADKIKMNFEKLINSLSFKCEN